jgi:hypothetical protein
MCSVTFWLQETVLTRIMGPKNEKVAHPGRGGGNQNEEAHNLYLSPNTTSLIYQNKHMMG